MEERGMNERVRMLRRQSVETQPHIYMERAKLMTEGHGHDTAEFIREPKKNKWFDKWKGKKNHYCNRDFLREFGYDIKDVQYYGVSNIPMPSNIDELMEPHLNF